MSIAFFIPDSQIIRTFAKVIKNGDARPCPPFYKRAGRQNCCDEGSRASAGRFLLACGRESAERLPCRRGR